MKIDVPSDHQPLVSTPDGPKCATCRYVDAENHSCRSTDYQAAELSLGDWSKRSGDADLPPGERLEDLCSDWWEGGDAGSARDRLVSAIRSRR